MGSSTALVGLLAVSVLDGRFLWHETPISAPHQSPTAPFCKVHALVYCRMADRSTAGFSNFNRTLGSGALATGQGTLPIRV
jgi:hypothetical protein